MPGEKRRRYAIESDGGKETESVIAGKAQAYRAAATPAWVERYGRFPIVVWVVRTEARLRDINRIWAEVWPDGKWLLTVDSWLPHDRWIEYHNGQTRGADALWLSQRALSGTAQPGARVRDDREATGCTHGPSGRRRSCVMLRAGQPGAGELCRGRNSARARGHGAGCSTRPAARLTRPRSLLMMGPQRSLSEMQPHRASRSVPHQPSPSISTSGTPSCAATPRSWCSTRPPRCWRKPPRPLRRASRGRCGRSSIGPSPPACSNISTPH